MATDPTDDRRRPGRPPNPEPSVTVTIRLPAPLYDRIASCAIAAKMAVTAVMRDVLDRHGPRGKEDAGQFPYSRNSD